MGSVTFLWSGNLGVLGGVRLNWLWLATVGESLWFALAGTTIGQESGGQRHHAANPFPSRRARVVATSSAMPSSPPSSARYLRIKVICAESWQRGAAFPHSALPAPGSVNSICNRISPAATSRSLPAVLVSVRPSPPTRSSRGRRRFHSWASSCTTAQRRSWRWCLESSITIRIQQPASTTTLTGAGAPATEVRLRSHRSTGFEIRVREMPAC